MKNRLFNSVQIKKPRKNVFDLSHEKKLSCNMGDLIPVYLQEVVPGDKFRVNTEIMMRLAPMIAPMMHRVNVYMHYFFVPNRLVYEDWPKFITGGEDGKQEPAFPTVQIKVGELAGYQRGALGDYFGIPTPPDDPAFEVNLNALPFRAYQLIYNEYYRDQNLQAPIAITKASVVDATEMTLLTQMRKRCWEKDYLTSALPWAQRGDEVMLPNQVVSTGDAATLALQVPGGGLPVDGPLEIEAGEVTNGITKINLDNHANVEISINDLRRSARLQEWLEKNARGGSRYIEQILSHFGVRSSDARLQRPEYLGGGKQPIVISEVLSTAETTDLPQGNMAGHGISMGKTNNFQKFFEEHGFILGIMSTLPRTAYQDGIHRMWRKFDKFDYYFPEFANLGEQEVQNYEVFMDYKNVGNLETFGYQSRFSEYKFANSTVHGDFRVPMDYYHMGRKFTARPSLNSGFVTADPTHRVFASTDVNEHKLYCQIYHDVKAIRPMPVFGTPTL